MPSSIPQTHCGIVGDGRRYVYFASGQIGPQCSPCIASVNVYDVENRSWASLPPLPAPRYAPVAVLLGGRLHVISGSKEDRYTPAYDHWSIAVHDGQANEADWRVEPPIPRAGMHRAGCVISNRIYVFGGQEGDVQPVEDDPQFRCDWNSPPETVFGDVYSYDADKEIWSNTGADAGRRFAFRKGGCQIG